METATVLTALLDAKRDLRKKVEVLRAFLRSQKGPGVQQGASPALRLLEEEALKRGAVEALRTVLAHIHKATNPKGRRSAGSNAARPAKPKPQTPETQLLNQLAGPDHETAIEVIKAQGIKIATFLLTALIRALKLLESAPPDSKAAQAAAGAPSPRPEERERALALRVQIPEALKELSGNCNVAELVRIVDRCRHGEARRLAFQALCRYRPYPQEMEVICAQLVRLRPSPELNELLERWARRAR